VIDHDQRIHIAPEHVFTEVDGAEARPDLVGMPGDGLVRRVSCRFPNPALLRDIGFSIGRDRPCREENLVGARKIEKAAFLGPIVHSIGRS
jgi:hypothetical protein